MIELAERTGFSRKGNKEVKSPLLYSVRCTAMGFFAAPAPAEAQRSRDKEFFNILQTVAAKAPNGLHFAEFVVYLSCILTGIISERGVENIWVC